MSNDPAVNIGEQTIGLSHLGRPLQVSILGRRDRPLRVLLICGQHGDERAIRNAVNHFMKSCGPSLALNLPMLQLAVMADANPDGSAERQRPNAQGIDLNRDHVLLRAPETRAIHAFVRSWKPHLIVDLHNYPSRRKELVQQGLRLGWDVCLDIPTNPAAHCRPTQLPFILLFCGLDGVAQRNGFQFGRYGLLGADGSFRHGTPQLGDARNTLALRYEVPTLLLEMRNPGRKEGSADRQFLIRATTSALCEICHWAARERAYLLGYKHSAQVTVHAGARLPLSFRRQASAGCEVPVINLDTGELSYLAPTRVQCKVQGRRHRSLPARYFVEAEDWPWLELIRAQGFIVQKCPKHSGWEIPLEQVGGRLLALLLEHESVYRTRWAKILC